MAFWNLMKKKVDSETPQLSQLIGIDLGYGQIKSVSGAFKIRFLSAVGTPVSDFGRVAAVTTEKELLESLSLTYSGKKYYVGHNAIVNTRNGRLSLRQNKAENEDNKIKFMTALALFTDEDQEYAEFDVVTGLPVLEFKNQQEALYNMIYNNGKPFEFIMHYGPKQVKKIFKINSVRIISQGEGAFYDYILDTNGTINSNANLVGGTVMVVDSGYRTTDIVTMENGKYIEPLSNQINNGINQMHQEVLRLIMERLNIKKELKDMDEIIRSRKLFYNMKEYDVSKIIADAARPYAEDIVDNLHILTNDQLGSLQRVLLGGGGGNIILPYVKTLLEGVVEVSLLNDSEFCNASGYFKYGSLLLTQTNTNAGGSNA
jgi:plasmid segregation protein ParM